MYMVCYCLKITERCANTSKSNTSPPSRFREFGLSFPLGSSAPVECATTPVAGCWARHIYAQFRDIPMAHPAYRAPKVTLFESISHVADVARCTCSITASQCPPHQNSPCHCNIQVSAFRDPSLLGCLLSRFDHLSSTDIFVTVSKICNCRTSLCRLIPFQASMIK